MHPRYRLGANTPPDPPDPRVVTVAASLSSTSPATIAGVTALSVSASCMVSYPTPQTPRW